MKLLAAGGGSGGHVTPVLAVINELGRIDPDLETLFVCDRSFEAQARGLMSHAERPVTVRRIAAGKLRRYHNRTWRERLSDIETVLFNLRDIFYIVVGFVQSIWIILRFRPDVVFAKGGFVCLPIGLAAHLCRVPLVIHDSDTRPGLTNAILGRFAHTIATGSPLENYRYPAERSHYIGVPIDGAFQPMSQLQQREAKAEIGIIDVTAPLVVITGGGLGAKTINDAIIKDADTLLAAGIHVYHVCGKLHYDHLKQIAPEHPHYHLVPFVYKDMHRVLGAADVIVARGSATFLQEMAAMAKPVIVIPSRFLGDQVKNAAMYGEAEAVRVLSDHEIGNSSVLADTVIELMTDTPTRTKLARKLHTFAKPHAASDLARLIDAARRG
ncbi:MAG: glycosyltransferase [Candidatus Saccharimonadales bacterium]